MKIYTWLIAVTYFLITSMLFTTPQQQETAAMLCNKWQLDSYSVLGKKYAPHKNEKDDFIHFKENRTFTSKSAGKKEKGNYLLNTNGASVLMTTSNGDTTKAYILSISQESVVLKYDVPEINEVEVHYNTAI
jgi:hypothetical protein